MPPTPPGTSPTVTVVIAARNERHRLPRVLAGLPGAHEVIVVDEGSDDDTVAVARAAGPHVRVVRPTRTGRGNALACGFAAASGDIVVTLPADGTADPRELPKFVAALRSGAEAAHGSRFRPGGTDRTAGRAARLGYALLGRLVAMLFGVRCTDPAPRWHAYWRAVLPVLDLPATEPVMRRGAQSDREAARHLPGPVWGDGPEIATLLAVRAAVQGLRVVEVPCAGYPPMSGPAARHRPLRALRTVLREWRRSRHGLPAPARLAPVRREPVPPSPVPHDPVPPEPVHREPVPLSPVPHDLVPPEPVYREPVHREATRREPVPLEPVYREPGSPEPAPRLPAASGSLYDTLTGIGYDRSAAPHETTGGVRYPTSEPPPTAGRRPDRGSHWPAQDRPARERWNERVAGRHAVPGDPAVHRLDPGDSGVHHLRPTPGPAPATGADHLRPAADGGRFPATGAGVHHLSPVHHLAPGDRRHRAGVVYGSGLADTGTHHWGEPDERLLRAAPPREVGDGRRRLESGDRPGPGLSVVPDDGDAEGIIFLRARRIDRRPR